MPLLEWLQGLVWPSRSQQDENPNEVAFLELFVCFTVNAGLLPLLEVRPANEVVWVAHDSPEGRQLPETSRQMLARFVRRVRGLERRIGRDLLLAIEQAGSARLCPLAVSERLEGLDARPPNLQM